MECPLLEKIKRSTRLPSPPGAALKILQLCRAEDISLAELADTLATDPALSLRILKYANSALVGCPREITTIREAVTMLGIRSVRVMALSFSLLSRRDRHACPGFDYDCFWAHSLACAVAARQLASRNPPPLAEEAFAAGLLAHIGKLVFAAGMPEAYAEVLQVAGGTLGRTEQHEVSCLGTSHFELGAALLAEWGIPKRLVEAVRYQHDPEAIVEDPEAKHLAVILSAATNVADILCEAGDETLLAARREALAATPWAENSEQLDRLLGEIRERFQEMAAILALAEAAERSPEEIQAEAGAVLGELSIHAQLHSELARRENQTLQEKAFTDGLTGIPNRAAFDTRLDEAWDRAVTRREPLALILVDVDHFKAFNDTYGHPEGDEVLKAVARALAGAVRQVDFVARYGGEEFAAIVPNADRMTVAATAVKMRKAVESARIEVDQRTHRVTVSVGVALLPAATPPFTPARLLEVADQQLYAAKQQGRNRCCMKQLHFVEHQPVATAH